MHKETKLEKAIIEFYDKYKFADKNLFKESDRDKLNNYNNIQNIAQEILSGYFSISNEDGEITKIIKPICVEIYLHEEYSNDILEKKYYDNPQEKQTLVKDYIVYHRNRPKDKQNKPIFISGTLNNHMSGIDITFEKAIIKDNQEVNVRASALIRGFYEYDNKNDLRKEIIDKNKVENRSTYLYNSLYSSTSIFNGITIKWNDDENNTKINIGRNTRKNVYKYEFNSNWDNEDKKSTDYAFKKEKNTTNIDEREWQFYNKAYYDNKPK